MASHANKRLQELGDAEQPRLQAKSRFIRAIAEFLCSDVGRKSIELEMGKPGAKEWSALRCASPIRGYATVDEGEQILRELWLCPRNGPEGRLAQ